VEGVALTYEFLVIVLPVNMDLMRLGIKTEKFDFNLRNDPIM
jgi:hypothetical protein